jgi:hypothetical protein
MERLVQKTMGQIRGKISLIVPGDMGSCIIYRRKDIDQPMESLMMGSDDWGQYGTSMIEQYRQFILEYREIPFVQDSVPSGSLKDSCTKMQQHLTPSDEEDQILHLVEKQMGQRHNPIYVIVPGGMGSCRIFRRKSFHQSIESMCMGSDDWGQYGDNTMIDQYYQFIDGYQKIESV